MHDQLEDDQPADLGRVASQFAPDQGKPECKQRRGTSGCSQKIQKIAERFG